MAVKQHDWNPADIAMHLTAALLREGKVLEPKKIQQRFGMSKPSAYRWSAWLRNAALVLSDVSAKP